MKSLPDFYLLTKVSLHWQYFALFLECGRCRLALQGKHIKNKVKLGSPKALLHCILPVMKLASVFALKSVRVGKCRMFSACFLVAKRKKMKTVEQSSCPHQVLQSIQRGITVVMCKIYHSHLWSWMLCISLSWKKHPYSTAEVYNPAETFTRAFSVTDVGPQWAVCSGEFGVSDKSSNKTSS